LSTVNTELASRLSNAIYLLNQSEVVTSHAEVESQRAVTSLTQFQDELTSLRRNVSRVSDVTQATASRAHNFRVCAHAQ